MKNFLCTFAVRQTYLICPKRQRFYLHNFLYQMLEKEKVLTEINFNRTDIAFAGKTNMDLYRARFLFRIVAHPFLTQIGTAIMQALVKINFPGIRFVVKKTIFKQFCGGENLIKTKKTLQALAKQNVKVILDYAVEAKQDEKDFDATRDAIVNALKYAENNPNIPFVSLKITGLGKLALLEKISSDKPLSGDEKSAYERIRKRLDIICMTAYKNKTGVYIDAEESWIQQAIDDMTDQVMAKYNKESAIIYNTIQLYRTDRLTFLKKSFEKAQHSGYQLAVKLVRGAYMEKERKRAAEQGYPSPIHKDKKSVDVDYNAAVNFCLANIHSLSFCAATHNEESSKILAEQIISRELNVSDKRIWFGQLYGMGDNISFNLANAGYNVSKYLPYGPVKEVIPYLVRRAEENTSVAGQTGRELQLIQKEINRRKKTV